MVRRKSRAVSRRDFLKLGGAGLAGAALLGTAGCGGGSGQGEVIRMFVGTAETSALEREAEALVTRFDEQDRKSTRLNSSHANISYAVFCLKKKKNKKS